MIDDADDRRLVPQVHRRSILLHGLQQDRQAVVNEVLLTLRVLRHRGNERETADARSTIRNFVGGLRSRDGLRNGSRERQCAEVREIERVALVLEIFYRMLEYYYKDNVDRIIFILCEFVI